MPLNPNEPETSKSIEAFLNRAAGDKEQDSILAILLNIMERDTELRGLYKYNDFSGDIEHTGEVEWSNGIKENSPITDNDITELMAYIAKKYNLSPPDGRVHRAVRAIALRKKYHPIKDYLEGLTWDGKERIGTWLIELCGASDNEYTRAVGRKVLVGAVKRIYEPGCQFDYMMILESEEGIGKSTLLQILGGDWYSTLSFNMTNKEIIDQMRSKWIFEIEEMHAFDRVERSKVKALITRRVDRCRLSFGHYAQDFKRSNILVGTMNPEGENKYLDEGKNRRFWPIACQGMIDVDGVIAIKDQLWAEAVVMMRTGEKLMLQGKEDDIGKEIIDERRYNDDPWDAQIGQWLTLRVEDERLTASQIMTECLKIPVERQNRGFAGRVGRAVKKCGWVLKREITGKHRGYFYVKENGVDEQVQEVEAVPQDLTQEPQDEIKWED